MTHLDLFSGIGGFALAAQTVWGKEYHCVGFCEIDPFCQQVLKKNFPGVRIWGDIKELKWNEANDRNNTPLNSPPSPTQSRKLGESSVNASVAESLFPCPPALRSEAGVSVLSSADTSSCVENAERTPGAVSGCVENATPSGKTEPDMSEGCGSTKIGSTNGDGVYSQEITTPVSCADTSQGNPILSTLTTSSHGASIQKNGSTSPTGSPFVSNATRSCTEKNGRPSIDLLTAGVPCQPASTAGKRRGKEDDRWLWGEAYRLIREARPKWVILENVRGLLTLGNGVVFEDLLTELESYGYETETCVIPACAVNAPHRRDRVWIVGHLADSESKPSGSKPDGISGESRGNGSADASVPFPGTEGPRCEGREREGNICPGGRNPEYAFPDWTRDWREVAFESCIYRVDDGLPRRLVRLPDGERISESKWRQNALKCYGNAIVPQVAMEIMKCIKAVDAAAVVKAFEEAA